MAGFMRAAGYRWKAVVSTVRRRLISSFDNLASMDAYR